MSTCKQQGLDQHDSLGMHLEPHRRDSKDNLSLTFEVLLLNVIGTSNARVVFAFFLFNSIRNKSTIFILPLSESRSRSEFRALTNFILAS